MEFVFPRIGVSLVTGSHERTGHVVNRRIHQHEGEEALTLTSGRMPHFTTIISFLVLVVTLKFTARCRSSYQDQTLAVGGSAALSGIGE